MSHYRVPTLSHSNIVIRLAQNPAEVACTNQLVFGSYVSAKYWENEAKNLQNVFLHTPMRKVIVATEGSEIVGTISLILDSPLGLPSENAQPALIRQLRAKGGRLGEISGFAIDRSKNTQRQLAPFLLSYAFQYSYFYEGVDQLAASCVAAHARYYQAALGCSRISEPTHYATAPLIPYFFLIGLDLQAAYVRLSNMSAKERSAEGDFQRFLLRVSQPYYRFPHESQLKRARHGDPANRCWEAVA